MTERDDQRLDDRLARMFRAFEGPPDARPRRARGPQRVRRALLVAAAAVTVAAIGVGAALLGDRGEGRRAAVPGARDCEELRALGRRYLARPVPAGALAVGRPLAAPATLVCDGTRVPDADAARAGGLPPALVLVRPAERGIAYVAAGRCPRVGATALVACLHKEGAAP